MLKLGLLGPFYAELDGTVVEGFVSAKAQSLLCYLAMNRTAHSRQLLAGLFWGDAPEKKALGTLRVTLSNLRKLVPGYLESTRVTVSFRHDRPNWLDVGAVDNVVRALETSDIAALEGALSLVRGEFLEDFYIDGSPDFEMWLLNQRAYWRQATLRILARLATCYMDRQQYEQAAITLRQSLHLEPWDEDTHRSLMEALARAGDFNGALAQYEACCQALEAELGVEPTPTTTALYRRIQAARRQEAYPLPQDDAPFVGREEELARIEATLADPGCRLLTIVGLGGSGKTRLALAVARRAGEGRRRQFLNGVVFVPLATTGRSADLTPALAGALGLLLEGQESPARQVMKFLADKELLLILDNAEDLSGDIQLIQAIIQTAPDVKMLVTSREPLRLQAEWRLDLEGMRYPQMNGRGAAGVLAYEAVELFVRSARQAQPAFVLDDTNAADVVQVCRLVAGMPLGVTLAAAWARAMTTSEIAGEVAQSMDFLADQFRDLPSRQRSVRAVFESTWARLPEPDRRTFSALFIFCGGFTARAAAEIMRLTRSQLLSLVDRGLVQRLGRQGDEERYDLHPLMRQFAGEKLGEGKYFEEVAEKHGRVYLDLVMANEDGLLGPAPQVTLSALRLELDNLRQAWQWAAGHGQLKLLQNAAPALAALYEFAGLFEEGAHAFSWAAEQVDRQAPGEARSSVLCDLLAYQIRLMLERGVTDVGAIIERLETLTRRLNDDLRLAKLYFLQGLRVERLRGFEGAISYYERAAELFEALQQPRDLALALNALGFALANQGISAQALEEHRRSLRIAQELDDVRLQVLALSLMGVASHYLSRHRDALAYWEEALAHYVQLEDDRAILRTSNNICYVQNMLGNYEEALHVAERLQRLLIRVADHVSESDTHDTLGDIYFSTGDYSQARYHYLQAIENARAGRFRLKEAWCLTGLAELEIASGRYAFAENHLENAQALYQEEDHPRDRTRLLAALGELCRRRGRHRQAIDISLQLVEGLDEGGEPIYASPLLVRAASIFLESGDLVRAEGSLERGLMLAQSIGHRPTIWQARLLRARLGHLQGAQNATQALEELLPEAQRDSERADVLYALWWTTKEDKWGIEALALYRELAARTPDVTYRARKDELEGGDWGLEIGD